MSMRAFVIFVVILFLAESGTILYIVLKYRRERAPQPRRREESFFTAKFASCFCGLWFSGGCQGSHSTLKPYTQLAGEEGMSDRPKRVQHRSLLSFLVWLDDGFGARVRTIDTSNTWYVQY